MFGHVASKIPPKLALLREGADRGALIAGQAAPSGLSNQSAEPSIPVPGVSCTAVCTAGVTGWVAADVVPGAALASPGLKSETGTSMKRGR